MTRTHPKIIPYLCFFAKTALINCFLLFASGCTSSKDFTHTVKKVDLQKYMGTWYVISARPTFLEKGAFNSTESYTWNPEKKRIDIDFTYTKGSLNGPLKHIYQKGWVYNSQTNAHWKISPLWPFRFDYLIIALDANYQWSVVGVPSQKYLWIMSRHRYMSNDLLNKIKDEIRRLGYSTDSMIDIKHDQ